MEFPIPGENDRARWVIRSEGAPRDWLIRSLDLHYLEAAQSRSDDQILSLSAVGNMIDGLKVGKSQPTEHGDGLLRFTARRREGLATLREVDACLPIRDKEKVAVHRSRVRDDH